MVKELEVVYKVWKSTSCDRCIWNDEERIQNSIVCFFLLSTDNFDHYKLVFHWWGSLSFLCWSSCSLDDNFNCYCSTPGWDIWTIRHVADVAAKGEQVALKMNSLRKLLEMKTLKAHLEGSTALLEDEDTLILTRQFFLQCSQPPCPTLLSCSHGRQIHLLWWWSKITLLKGW